MVWWIVLAVVVAALLFLLLAVAAVLRRLPRLTRAAITLRRNQAQALELRESAGQLQAHLLTMQARVEEAQRRITVITAKTDE